VKGVSLEYMVGWSLAGQGALIKTKSIEGESDFF